MRVVILRKKSNYFSKYNGLIWLWLSLIVIIADQLSKCFVLDKLTPGQQIQWLPFFNISLAFNTGAAFSFLGGASGWQMPFISVVVLVVTTVLVLWVSKLAREGSRVWMASWV